MSNIQPYIILNGTDSRTITGLLISALPPISKPLQRTLVDVVDGRDGDINTPLGFSAYDKTVEIGLTYGYDIDEIIEYFNSEGVVTFSNEPDKYYRYAIYEQIDFERLIRFKTAEVTLHCQPFKFSTTETPELFNVTSGSPITVTNDGNTQSRPNLTIIGDGEVDLSLNGSQILSMDLADNQAIIIDTEDMNAYAAQSAIKEVIAEINSIQEGSGDPSPDNIRPITGVSSVNVTRCGKNLLPMPITSGSYSNQVTITVNNDKSFYISKPSGSGWTTIPLATLMLKKGTYTLIEDDDSSENCAINVYLAGTTTSLLNTRYAKRYVFTVAEDTKVDINYSRSAAADNVLTKLMLFVGNTATATDYEPYNGNTYLIQLDDTYYGATLDVVRGKLVVTHNVWVSNGSENWIANSSTNGYYTTSHYQNDSLTASDNGKSNYFTYKWSFGQQNGCMAYTNRIQLNNTSFASVEDLQEAFNQTPLVIVYPLATPIEIQLTPQIVNNLLGLNQMYCDTNGDIEVTVSSNGVIQTLSGEIVSFTIAVEDMQKGILLNRLVTGDYDKIRLNKGNNTLVLSGGAQQLVIDKYSRWI